MRGSKRRSDLYANRTQRPPVNRKKGRAMDAKVEVKGKSLIITLPLQKATPSASGKTLVVASTRGNVVTDAKVDGKPVIVGVNAYIKP